MADAGDEAMALTRGADTEEADSAIFPSEVDMFMRRIESLFTLGHAYDEHAMGYATYFLKMMREQRFSFIVNGNLIAIGGCPVPMEARARCLKHMHDWVRIARDVCKAEFPAYEIIAAFAPFNVIGRHAPNGLVGRSMEAETCLRRLANVYAVDASRLIDQYYDYLPRAIATQKLNGTNNGESWKHAVLKAQLRRSVAQGHPAQELVAVLKRYCASSISTSGVEQSWSKCCWLFGSGRGGADEFREACMVKVVVDYKPLEHDRTIQRARELWAKVYGIPRDCSREHRITMGVKRHRNMRESTT